MESERVPLAPDTLEMLAAISTASITMQLLKRGLRQIFIREARPLTLETASFAAEAYTLRFIPMREDLSRTEILGDPEYPPRKAIEAAPAGSALVIDARGRRDAGVVGDILTARLKVRGVAALVADGPVRDARAVAATGLPVYCNGAAAPVSLNIHFGADLERPIACGGVAVFPGDVLVGDGDGVAVIPRALADEVARDGTEQEALEAFLKARIEAGSPVPGTYPPNQATLDAYARWCKQREGT